MRKMVDNEDQQNDRRDLPHTELPEQQPSILEGHNHGRVRHTPNRANRRKIAKRRGVFKTPGLWPYINQRSTNRVNEAHSNDNN